MLLDEKVQDVCIQDPRRETAYLIPGAGLSRFATDSPDTEGAVTFTISDDALVDVVPEATPTANAEPDVIIRHGDTGRHFRLTFTDLQQFRISRPESHPIARTFTLPMSESLVEEMPAAVRALLQTDFETFAGRSGPARRS